ncbi:hypothetical protein AB1L30_15965 [Bremerella sp. JC817]|uniref:rolling circle replication-associated protein n=1 Tax=Bremerella sp. JC817 TaxID=3231756 RepID=UPI0034585C21
MDLRRRLKAVLQTFEAVQMWTFTVDPLLFSSPRQAWDYLKEKRCISRLMRSLRNGGYLLSDRYFYVVEWQKETEMVHFHVLVEARHIPIERVRYEWSKFRPDWAGPQEPNRPAFGTVRFTKTKPFVSMEHAANYATKYLTKTPEHGFPSWVLDSQTYMRRYQTSRYFWPAKDEPNGTDADDVLQPGQRAGDTQSPEEEEAQQEAERTTIRQRLAECKQGATVILKVRTNYPDGRVFDGTRHVMNIGFSFARCLEILGFRDVDLRKLSLSPAQLRVLDREWLRFEKDGPDGSEN